MYPVEDAQQLAPFKEDKNYMPPDLLWRPNKPAAWLEAIKHCEHAQVERDRRRKQAFSRSQKLVSQTRSFFEQKVDSRALNTAPSMAG